MCVALTENAITFFNSLIDSIIHTLHTPNENKFDYLAAIWALLTRFVFLCETFI